MGDGSERPNSRQLEKLAGGEFADEAAVCGQEFVFGQVFEPNPLELMEDLVVEFTREGRNREELQVDGAPVAVVVPNMGDAGTYCGVNAEFFLEFAGKRLLWAFALLYFPARKFPLERHGLVGTPLADQHLAVSHQKPCDNETERRPRWARIGLVLRLFHPSSVNGWVSSQM